MGGMKSSVNSPTACGPPGCTSEHWELLSLCNRIKDLAFAWRIALKKGFSFRTLIETDDGSEVFCETEEQFIKLSAYLDSSELREDRGKGDYANRRIIELKDIKAELHSFHLERW
jgi:hypothetical protein